jgi:serine/threonine protein kinase
MVVKAKHLETAQEVAIKCLNKQANEKYIQKEIGNMLAVRGNPYLINLHAVMEDSVNYYIVMDLARGGPFFNLVSDNKRYRRFFTPEVAKRYFLQLISAIEHCHTHNVVHRDLKLENILLDENANLKLCDFGMSSVIDGPLRGFCGTRKYMAPEVFDFMTSHIPYDGPASDRWSCGILLYLILACDYPFKPNLQQDAKYNDLVQGTYPWPACLEENFPGSVEFLSLVLDPNPKTRMTFAQMRQHSWLREAAEHFAATELVSSMQTISLERGTEYFDTKGVRATAISVVGEGHDVPTTTEIFGSDEPVYRAMDGISEAGTVMVPLQSFDHAAATNSHFETDLTAAEVMAVVQTSVVKYANQASQPLDFTRSKAGWEARVVVGSTSTKAAEEDVRGEVPLATTLQLFKGSQPQSRLIHLRRDQGDVMDFGDLFDVLSADFKRSMTPKSSSAVADTGSHSAADWNALGSPEL